MVKVLFVCMGNICRSPTAEGVFAKLVQESELAKHIHVDSAGTHAYHVGDPPDERAQQAALRRGVDLGELRARKVTVTDLEQYDYILAMDSENLRHLQSMCPAQHREKLFLLMDFSPDYGHREVPDPYYGGQSGFERVLDMAETAAVALFEAIRQRHF